MSFKRSFTLIPIDPPVAWKKDPCGRWSKIVAPAFTIAAPQMAVTPAATIASAKDAEAIVAPAVVEAVAADINAPAIGATMVDKCCPHEDEREEEEAVNTSGVTPRVDL